MELSFKDLAKREVINVPDGRCLGHIVDLTLDFPKGIMVGITVPAKKTILNIFGFYEKLFIEDYKIKKIGSDVILVDLKAPPPKPLPPPNPCDFNPCKPPRHNDDEYE
ncbi:MAG: YlmC/YmxH family sporulation protein [Clostridia bacterium]|nr:YlmC/YmxH family sporulation protein [Clostridia bacterium]